MPTVLRSGPYRLYFYSGDRDEPPHVHVQRDNDSAKFWLEPVRLAKSVGFNNAELNQLQKLMEDNSDELLRSWHDFFST